MFEIFCTITDELGSRVVPTGHGFSLEVCAEDRLAQLQRSYPDGIFWVDYTALPYPY
jgi:hypothetical protein